MGRARGIALPGRPRRPSRAGDALPRPGERGRPPAAARATLDHRSPRRSQEAGPRQQPHGRYSGRRAVLRRRSRDARLRLARRGRGLVPRQLRPPRDGARRPRLRALPPLRVRDGRHREDARHARPPRPPRSLARLGAGPPRDRGEHRELRPDRRGGVLRRALLRHGAAPGRPRAPRLSGRPLLVEHVGAAAAAVVLPLRPGRDRVRAGEPRDARPRPAAARRRSRSAAHAATRSRARPRGAPRSSPIRPGTTSATSSSSSSGPTRTRPSRACRPAWTRIPIRAAAPSSSPTGSRARRAEPSCSIPRARSTRRRSSSSTRCSTARR